MDDQLYERAWDVVEPIMHEYLTLSGRFQVPLSTTQLSTTQQDYNRERRRGVHHRDILLDLPKVGF